MSAINLKGTGDTISGGGFFNSTILHDATGTPIESPTGAGATLVIPQGAGLFKVKTAGTVSFLLPDDTDPGGAATQETTDGFVEYHICGCGGKNNRYPNRIVLSAAANFMFCSDTPDGGNT